MNLTILKCHSGHLKISIPKFKVDTTKYNCLNNGDKILDSINYINEDLSLAEEWKIINLEWFLRIVCD